MLLFLPFNYLLLYTASVPRCWAYLYRDEMIMGENGRGSSNGWEDWGFGEWREKGAASAGRTRNQGLRKSDRVRNERTDGEKEMEWKRESKRKKAKEREMNWDKKREKNKSCKERVRDENKGGNRECTRPMVPKLLQANAPLASFRLQPVRTCIISFRFCKNKRKY